ncbi:MAG: hypothetical protein ACI9CA_001772 [Natronomonas sp.]
MIRAVLAVALAVALLGVSVPVVEEAGRAHSDARVTNQLDRVESAAQALRARSAAATKGVTARRTLSLSLPERTWAHPGLVRLTVPAPGDRARVTWRVEGGAEHSRWLLDGDVVGPPGGLTLRTGGTLQVALLLRPNGTVQLWRLRFITERGSTTPHGTTRPAVR